MKKITDKMRLDWLSERTTGSEVPEILEARYSHRREESAYTLRQAIDAAIRATPPRPKPCEKNKEK